MISDWDVKEQVYVRMSGPTHLISSRFDRKLRKNQYNQQSLPRIDSVSRAATKLPRLSRLTGLPKVVGYFLLGPVWPGYVWT